MPLSGTDGLVQGDGPLWMQLSVCPSRDAPPWRRDSWPTADNSACREANGRSGGVWGAVHAVFWPAGRYNSGMAVAPGMRAAAPQRILVAGDWHGDQAWALNVIKRV